MKLSQMIDLMTAMKTVHGDLEVLDDQFFSIRTVAIETITSKQAEEWEMDEGMMVARVVSNY